VSRTKTWTAQAATSTVPFPRRREMFGRPVTPSIHRAIDGTRTVRARARKRSESQNARTVGSLRFRQYAGSLYATPAQAKTMGIRDRVCAVTRPHDSLHREKPRGGSGRDPVRF